MYLLHLRFPRWQESQRLEVIRTWHQTMLRRLGIQLQAKGALTTGAKLLVANHISWLDILVINAVGPARFVSKSEVKSWPIIGSMVTAGGTLFIERQRKRDAMRVVHEMAAALSRGDTLAVFPEGTTSNGQQVLPFHANLFQAAISAQTPVQPLAIKYSDAQNHLSQAAPYIDEMTIAESFWKIVSAPRLVASIEILEPQPTSDQDDRRELAEQAEHQICQRVTS